MSNPRAAFHRRIIIDYKGVSRKFPGDNRSFAEQFIREAFEAMFRVLSNQFVGTEFVMSEKDLKGGE